MKYTIHIPSFIWYRLPYKFRHWYVQKLLDQFKKDYEEWRSNNGQ